LDFKKRAKGAVVVVGVVGALGGLGYVHQTPRNSLNINN